MRVEVLGAGIVGLACADELIRRGHRVRVVDPQPMSGASHVAAGMLCPSAEVWHGEEALLSLGRRSQALWPAYAERLGVDLVGAGTLLVGYDRADLQLVRRQADLLAGCGESAALQSARGVREHEPAVTARIAGGVLLPEDRAVDPRAVGVALLERVGCEPSRGDEPADSTVLATGAVLPPPWRELVRRVRGEAAIVRPTRPLGNVVRGWVRGRPIYVVPRADGRAVIGATSEEHDEQAMPTLGGIWRVLGDARELVPELDGAELLEVLAGDRPASRDNLPLIGPTDREGTFLAAGLYRHGVLLAPLVAQLLADAVEGAAPELTLDPRRMLGASSAREGGDSPDRSGELTWNGEACALPDTPTIAGLLSEAGLGSEGVAVARNGEVVPRSEHAATQLCPGDVIETVKAVQGG